MFSRFSSYFQRFLICLLLRLSYNFARLRGSLWRFLGAVWDPPVRRCRVVLFGALGSSGPSLGAFGVFWYFALTLLETLGKHEGSFVILLEGAEQRRNETCVSYSHVRTGFADRSKTELPCM